MHGMHGVGASDDCMHRTVGSGEMGRRVAAAPTAAAHALGLLLLSVWHCCSLAAHAAALWPETGVDWEAQQRQWESGNDPAADLQRKISTAVATGSSMVVVPPGNYFFGNRTLLIENATDFVLEAAGEVEFVFANSEGGVIIRSCNNIS